MTAWTTGDAPDLCDLANAAYLPADAAKAALVAVGATYVDRFGSDECQVLLADWRGFACVLWQGTQVTDADGSFDPSVPQFWDDIDGVPAMVDGFEVHSGFWSPMVPVAAEVTLRLPAGKPVLVVGHSLGGSRSHLSKKFWPEAEIVSCGAPKAAARGFWQHAYAGSAPPLRIVAEDDFAPNWPPFGNYVQPSARVWLHDKSIVVARGWPYIPGPASVPNHDILTSYRALSVAAAAAGVPMPAPQF